MTNTENILALDLIHAVGISSTVPTEATDAFSTDAEFTFTKGGLTYVFTDLEDVVEFALTQPPLSNC